jgi:hypothetical protein
LLLLLYHTSHVYVNLYLGSWRQRLGQVITCSSIYCMTHSLLLDCFVWLHRLTANLRVTARFVRCQCRCQGIGMTTNGCISDTHELTQTHTHARTPSTGAPPNRHQWSDCLVHDCMSLICQSTGHTTRATIGGWQVLTCNATRSPTQTTASMQVIQRHTIRPPRASSWCMAATRVNR